MHDETHLILDHFTYAVHLLPWLLHQQKLPDWWLQQFPGLSLLRDAGCHLLNTSTTLLIDPQLLLRQSLLLLLLLQVTQNYWGRGDHLRCSSRLIWARRCIKNHSEKAAKITYQVLQGWFELVRHRVVLDALMLSKLYWFNPISTQDCRDKTGAKLI